MLPFLQSALISRATGSGVFFYIPTRAKGLSGDFGIPPVLDLLLGRAYQSYPLEV
jgi:hypothetical protein